MKRLLPILHLATLAAFACSQPLFDLIAGTPEFLAVRHLDGRGILLFTLAVGALPWSLVALLGAAFLPAPAPLRRAAGYLIGAALLMLIWLPPLNRTALPEPAVILAAGLAAGLGLHAYRSLEACRLFLTLLAPAVLVFPLWFLLGTPVQHLITAQRDIAPLEVVVPERPPIVLLVFDELPLATLMTPQGRIDAERFPHFAALAGMSTWYRHATTVAAFTDRAVPALLSGRLPAEIDAKAPAVSLTDHLGMPIAADHPVNLFTILGGTYALNVSESITSLCPENLCPRDAAGNRPVWASLLADSAVLLAHLAAPASVRAQLPEVSTGWSGFIAAGATPARDADPLRGFLETMDAEPATLHYAHINLPHAPWVFDAEGREHRTAASSGTGTWPPEPQRPAAAFRKHLQQTRFVDRLLGTVVARLRQLGIFDAAMLIVVADHGAAFEPGHPMRDVDRANHVDIMGIPLLVKYPQQTIGSIDDERARSVDIVPTLLRQLGADSGIAGDGVPLQGRRPPSTTATVVDRAGRVHGFDHDPYASYILQLKQRLGLTGATPEHRAANAPQR